MIKSLLLDDNETVSPNLPLRPEGLLCINSDNSEENIVPQSTKVDAEEGHLKESSVSGMCDESTFKYNSSNVACGMATISTGLGETNNKNSTTEASSELGRQAVTEDISVSTSLMNSDSSNGSESSFSSSSSSISSDSSSTFESTHSDGDLSEANQDL